MDGAGVLRRLHPFVHAVVAHDRGDAQAVMGENAGTPSPLRRPVGGIRAPGAHRLLVAPEREQEQFAGLGEALEPLDRNEPVDALEVTA